MSTLVDLVGNTPLLDCSALLTGAAAQPGSAVRLLAKCEGDNPASSVKDRAAKGMILGALARGTIRPGMRLIEATSGNTGIALAMIARAVGLEMHLVIPANQSLERAQTMRAFGAVVHEVDGSIEDARDWALARVRESATQPDAFVMLNQFENPDNPQAHFVSTGPEIWRDTQGKISHFVSAMGTTGTIMGVSRYLKSVAPEVVIVGCQPESGAQIAGIRRWPPEYVPAFYESHRVDRIIDVAQAAAEATARRLAREIGLFTGPSSGGACWSALQIAHTLTHGTIVFIACDRGDRYLSTGLFG